VPSRNPNWSDCEGIEYCGVAQVFDFAIDGKKIWFTEWVENNIGVVDTSIPLPFSIDIDTQSITLEKGQTANVTLYVTSTILHTSSDLTDSITVNSSTTSLFSDIVVTSESMELYLNDGSKTIPLQITASEDALSGVHKVLLGVYNNDIAVSQFITVTIV
jgi:virginiamycin B lyase